MKAALFLLLVLVLHLSPSFLPPQASPQSPSITEEAARMAADIALQFMEEGKYPEALEHFRKAIQFYKEDPEILYNGGLAAFLAKEFPQAIEWWKKVATLTPKDGQVWAKLVQAYQASGNLAGRDAARDALLELYRSKADEEFSKREFYCREQMEIRGRRIFAFEHFELKGDRAVRYVFVVLKDDSDEENYRISLGSYKLTNDFAIQSGSIKPGERRFHLDGYFNWGHATYGFFTAEPTYDATREMFINILEEKLKPVSSSTIPSKK